MVTRVMIEDFEVVTDWTFTEVGTGTKTGEQDSNWKTQGTYSYKLYVSKPEYDFTSSYARLSSNDIYSFNGYSHLMVDVKATIDSSSWYMSSGSISVKISENGTDWTTIKTWSVGENQSQSIEETWVIDITNYQGSYYIRFEAHKVGPIYTSFNFDYLSKANNLREIKENIYCTDGLEPIYSLDNTNFSPLTSFRTEKTRKIITLSLPRKGEYVLQRVGDEAKTFYFTGYLLSTQTQPTLRDTKRAKLEKALSTDAIIKFVIPGETTFYGKITSLSFTDMGGDPLAYVFAMEGLEVIL